MSSNKNSYKGLDQTSEYYKICENDQVPYMAYRIDQKYCCRACAVAMDNRKKREKKNNQRNLVIEAKEVLKSPAPAIQSLASPEAKVTAATPNVETHATVSAARSDIRFAYPDW